MKSPSKRFIVYIDNEQIGNEFNSLREAERAAEEECSDGSDREIEIFQRVKSGTLVTRAEWDD